VKTKIIINKIKITDMNKIKLNKLAQNAMKAKEMNHIKGGSCCGCGCKYQGTPGGSSIAANKSANAEKCLLSPPDIEEVIVKPN
jgi:natural product precursor